MAVDEKIANAAEQSRCAETIAHIRRVWLLQDKEYDRSLWEYRRRLRYMLLKIDGLSPFFCNQSPPNFSLQRMKYYSNW